MPQLNFEINHIGCMNQSKIVNNGSLSFVPFNVNDSISLNNFNIIARWTSTVNKTITLSIGLYSLSGGTLSIENSLSISKTNNTNNFFYISATATSKTQNITPGTWYFGLLASTSGASNFSFLGNSVNPQNVFPGSFIGGAMTASTDALPSSIATSDLNITGDLAMLVPIIILSA